MRKNYASVARDRILQEIGGKDFPGEKIVEAKEVDIEGEALSLVVTQGPGPSGYGKAGRFLIQDEGRTVAGVAWFEEYGEKVVSYLYALPAYRKGKAMSIIFAEAKKRGVSKKAKGPFTKAGEKAVKRYGFEIEEASAADTFSDFYMLESYHPDFKDDPYLPSEMIYNFNALADAWYQGRGFKKEIEYDVTRIKKKYLQVFKPLILEQLAKYLSRGRVDPGVFDQEDLKLSTRYEMLDMYMKATYRSDMERRNTVWNALTTQLKNLEAAGRMNGMIEAITLINNAIHNTGESIFSKFKNGHILKQALDDVYSAIEPRAYRDKTSGIDYIWE